MTESKEAHRIRMRLKRSHPDWTKEMIRNEIKRELKSSQKVHKEFTSSQNQEKESSHSGSQVHKSSQPQVNEGSQEFTKGSQTQVKESSHSGSQEFTKGSQTQVKESSHSGSQVHKSSQNKKIESSQKFTKSSQCEPSTDIDAPERFILSYSRNKYQFTLYRLIEGKKILEGSKTKNQQVEFKNAIVTLTWGPEESEKEE